MKKAITTVILATTLMVTNSFAGIIIGSRSSGEIRTETKQTTCKASAAGTVLAAIAGIIIGSKTGIIITERLISDSGNVKCTESSERAGIIITE